jgi:Fe2+ or Zn2+ uptake regulation protein
MSIFLRFVNLTQRLEDEFVRTHSIDQRGVKVLEAIAIRHSQDQSLMTTDVMALSQFGSTATIYRSLWTLRDSGLVSVFHKGSDRRAKYLRPSDIAMSYYSQLGASLMESIVKESLVAAVANKLPSND